jgi:hypothetical protein
MTKGATPLKVAGGAAIKELLAGVTTVGLATNAFAKKLDHLRGFYSSAIDFEGGEPEVDGLAGCETEGYLFPIGQTGSGSVFALWSSKKTEEPKDGPIVYLDSEGDPRCAVARSLDDFLSVLPFGTGWIHDAARGTPSPAKQSLAAAATAQEAAEDQDGKPVLAGKPYADWWKGQFGVAPAKDPEGLVAAARSAKPTLEAWIRKKAG